MSNCNLATYKSTPIFGYFLHYFVIEIRRDFVIMRKCCSPKTEMSCFNTIKITCSHAYWNRASSSIYLVTLLSISFNKIISIIIIKATHSQQMWIENKNRITRHFFQWILFIYHNIKPFFVDSTLFCWRLTFKTYSVTKFKLLLNN